MYFTNSLQRTTYLWINWQWTILHRIRNVTIKQFYLCLIHKLTFFQQTRTLFSRGSPTRDLQLTSHSHSHCIEPAPEYKCIAFRKFKSKIFAYLVKETIYDEKYVIKSFDNEVKNKLSI